MRFSIFLTTLSSSSFGSDRSQIEVQAAPMYFRTLACASSFPPTSATELLVDELAVLLEAPGPEAARVVRLPLVMHLGEDEVEELPEGGVLRHALVAVDEVVAASEGRAQHLGIGATQLGVRGDVARADGLVGERPVADRLELHVEPRALDLEEEELEAVGPEAVLAVLAGRHRGLEHLELLRGLLVVAHLVRALVAELQLLLADDEAADVLRRVLGAGLEDGDVDLLVRRRRPSP